MLLYLDPPNFSQETIEKIEQHYGANFIFDLCIKDKNGNWTEQPIAIFYKENPDITKGHKNYFGIFVRNGETIICDATTVSEGHWNGLISDDKVYLSRFRHDYREIDGKFIDGGRDYCRSNSELYQYKLNPNNIILARKHGMEFAEI